ncbi:hypothetical protein WJX81_004421 [Elliptochloris bilobata]|uniref:Metallo-beta-lactamase domain-containing protein n=1 Tax=Elliptochloris bilobata TaxID=381761 RepID=A0AAW1RTB9_9CHLO
MPGVKQSLLRHEGRRRHPELDSEATESPNESREDERRAGLFIGTGSLLTLSGRLLADSSLLSLLERRSARRKGTTLRLAELELLGRDTGGVALREGALLLKRQLPLSLAGIEVDGISVAGQETCILLPRHKLVFDTGRCPQRAVYQKTVMVTHAHLDHIGGLPFLVSTRGMLGLPPPTVVLPTAIVDGTHDMLRAITALDGNPMACELLPLSPGGEYRHLPGFVVRPFATFHPVPSQGYLLYNSKQKLKPELAGLPGDTIRDRRLAGEEVTRMVEAPEVAFTGDTSAEFILHPGNEDVLRARLLIMELTFLDDEVTVEHARSFGHMHIDEFVEHAERFQNEAILLIHFSARYTAARIVELLDERLPPALRAKCTPLLAGFSDRST